MLANIFWFTLQRKAKKKKDQIPFIFFKTNWNLKKAKEKSSQKSKRCFTSEFNSHWMPASCELMPDKSNLSKWQQEKQHKEQFKQILQWFMSKLLFLLWSLSYKDKRYFSKMKQVNSISLQCSSCNLFWSWDYYAWSVSWSGITW